MKGCKKTGIMGGTFNPIHNGHLILANTAYEMLGLDEVLFMPSGNSYMKKNVIATKKRIDMVRLAIEKYPWFALSLVETNRQGNSYTSETLQELTKENPVLLLDDVLSELDSNRQNYLLSTIGDIQTIITCTGLDEFVNNRFEIDKVFKIENGRIAE